MVNPPKSSTHSGILNRLISSYPFFHHSLIFVFSFADNHDFTFHNNYDPNGNKFETVQQHLPQTLLHFREKSQTFLEEIIFPIFQVICYYQRTEFQVISHSPLFRCQSISNFIRTLFLM